MTLQKNTLLLLVVFTIVCALPAAAVVPSAIAQEDNDENLASSIVSEVLKDGAEANQDSTNTATVSSNQEDQTVDQDDTVILGDNTVDLDEGNVAVPIAIPISMEEVPSECPEGFAPENGQCRSTETTEPT